MGSAVGVIAAAPSLPGFAQAQGRPRRLPSPLPAPVSQDAKMAWFREAKYALFVHWGIYAIPGNVWIGRQIRVSSEWVMAHAKIPLIEYAPLARQFNPLKFDADQWVIMAKEAGMKYIVFSAKHHDGFAMYRSRVSAYNVYDATRFRRDPCRELAEACARHGMKLGFYYSQCLDWHEAGGFGNTWDFPRDDAKIASGAFDRYLQTKVEPQLRELLTGYGPVCMLFFDIPTKMDQNNRGQRIADLVHSLQPACLINSRLGIPSDYTTMGDNYIPTADVPGDWETPAEINHSWGWDKNDSDFKAPSDVLFHLMDIVGKGGNYLLNIGPTALGEIPIVAAENFRTLGRWLKVNGEAVYGATKSPFGEGLKDYIGPLKDEKTGRVFNYEFRDWRCTARPGKLYFTVFRWNRNFKLPAFPNAIKRAYMLTAPDTDLAVTGEANGERVVAAPQYGIDVMANVIVVEVDGVVALTHR